MTPAPITMAANNPINKQLGQFVWVGGSNISGVGVDVRINGAEDVFVLVAICTGVSVLAGWVAVLIIVAVGVTVVVVVGVEVTVAVGGTVGTV